MEGQEIFLLKQSASTIRQLRRENELMGARLEVYDQMMRLFHTLPVQQYRGMSPDITYDIDKFLESKLSERENQTGE
jgi:hypothetical protein